MNTTPIFLFYQYECDGDDDDATLAGQEDFRRLEEGRPERDRLRGCGGRETRARGGGNARMWARRWRGGWIDDINRMRIKPKDHKQYIEVL